MRQDQEAQSQAVVEAKKESNGLQNKQQLQNVKTAVLLAAGNGSRIREVSGDLPKPLIRLGGLLLIERAILNLKAAGVENFRVVVGYQKEKIASKLKSLKSLKGLRIEFIECEDFQKGNGASLAAGSRGLNEPFLLSMSDHVMSRGFVEDFVKKALCTPQDCALATDEDVENVFDLDDATKVATQNGYISRIGKELESYNQIDTGLFYFNKEAASEIHQAYLKGATSVSDMVMSIHDKEGFRTHVVDSKLFWQDVDTPSMAKEAEWRMMNSLRKPTDGWVSKNINRHVSLRISRRLANWNVHPNTVTTAVFFTTLYGAYLASTSNYLLMAIAGLIFQFCSIVDGCDGEIARMTYKGSHFGAWYDTITDNIRYGVFFCALGVGAYNMGGSVAYLWGMCFFAFSLVYMVASMIRYERTINAATHLVVTAKIEERGRQGNSLWNKMIMPVRGLIKQDVSAFWVMLFCLLGVGHWVFWAACFAILVMTITVTRALDPKAEGRSGISWLMTSPYLMIVGGVALFAYLFSQVSTAEVMGSLSAIGYSYLWIFFVAPPIWYAANSFSLWNLSHGKVKIGDLLYNQVVGEGFNALLPLAGLGGEPFKIKHLSEHLELPEATKIIVQDRLLHVVSGLLFSAILGFWTLSLEIAPAWQQAVMLVSGAFLMSAIAVAVVSLSRAPSKFTAVMVKKFRVIEEFRDSPLSAPRFTVSIFYKMIGRAAIVLEAFVLFEALNLLPVMGDLVAVTFFIAASSSIFFIVPQGIGVTEVGITGAFAMIGLSSPVALAFGVARRIRVLFWAFFGVGLFFAVGFFAKMSLASRRVEGGE